MIHLSHYHGTQQNNHRLKADRFVLRTESPDTRRLDEASNRVPCGNRLWDGVQSDTPNTA